MQAEAAKSVALTPAFCRPAERLILAYFLYMAVLATYCKITGILLFGAWAFPLAILLLCAAETRFGTRWTTYLRDWLPLSLILAGYYQVDLITGAPLTRLQDAFSAIDQFVLIRLGLHQAVELLGPVIPWILELVYLLLYAIPPFAMAAIYLTGRRRHAGQFLLIFFGGTFAAYALLPHFPTLAPREVFPNLVPPSYTSIWRSINLYNLTHLDISTSVFPSGHVAVAFASAYGLREVLSSRFLRHVFFVIAITVYLATAYCRYHYVADGAASFLLTTLVWLLCRNSPTPSANS